MLPSIRPVPVSGHKNRPYQFSVNKVFRMEAEDFSFKMQVFLSIYRFTTVEDSSEAARRIHRGKTAEKSPPTAPVASKFPLGNTR